MSFQGNAPNGTNGGLDNPMLVQIPEDVRIAVGSCYVAYLLVNGPISVRDKAAIQNVIRTIGAQGEQPVSLIIKYNNGVVDNNATELDFGAGVVVTEVSPGIVLIQIPTAGITNAMLAGEITPDKLDRVYRVGTQNNPVVHGSTALGTRAVSSNVSGQSPVTINFVPGVIYNGFVKWTFRGYASGSPANGAFTSDLGGTGQVNNPDQYDIGVDSSVVIRQDYDTSGGSSLVATWGFNWASGTLNITNQSMVEWYFTPRS